MLKKDKRLISIGPQFYMLLTDTIVAELCWGKKKSRRSEKMADRLVEEPRQIRRRLSGKLKIRASLIRVSSQTNRKGPNANQ
jgi:hypothetical protein